jgi:hypothetical protein
MRLVSKNNVRDYYDNMVSFGIDPKIVYVRKRELHSMGYDADPKMRELANAAASVAMRNKHLDIGNARNARRESRVDKGFIGFCGVFYPFLCVYTKKINLEFWREESVQFGTATQDCFDANFLYSEADIKRFAVKNLGHPGIMKLLKIEKFNNYFNSSESNAVFEALDVPLIALFEDGFHVNPCLQDFAFARIKPGQQAFQEISAYISGVLASKHQMKISKLSDKDMAVSKGFDNRSFRRDPQKRRG